MKTVTLHVRLPVRTAEVARRIDAENDDFFRRVVELAVIRHEIYASLRTGLERRAREAGERVMGTA